MPHLFAGRIRNRVGKAVIDGRKTCSAWITEVRNLDGGRLVRKNGQPVAEGVASEVNEDVDLVAANLLGNLLVRIADGRAPTLRSGLEVACHRIRVPDFCIAIDFHFVVVGENGLKKVRNGMVPEVRRYVANAQAAVGS